MASRRAIRICVVLTVLVAAALGVWFPRVYSQKRSQLACAGRLKNLATAFKVYAADLPGFPFDSSEAALSAMIGAGVVTQEDTISPISGAPLVLAFPGGIPPLNENRTVIAFEACSSDRACCAVVYADGHGECIRAD